MRSSYDCIISTSKTINDDNSFLNCRINGLEIKSPTIIILDNHLSIPLMSNVVKNNPMSNTIIFYNKLNKKKIKLLKKYGVRTYRTAINENGELNLKNILTKIKTLGLNRIFLESGLKLANNFLKENLVNDLKIFISNNKLNNNVIGNINNQIKALFKSKKYTFEKVNLLGDKLISYKIR